MNNIFEPEGSTKSINQANIWQNCPSPFRVFNLLSFSFRLKNNSLAFVTK